MNIPKAVSYLAAGTAASVTAVEFGIAIDMVKHVGTICGAVAAIVAVVKIARNWATGQVRGVVSAEIEQRFKLLACVQTRGLICDKDQDTDADVVTHIGGE